MWGGREIQSLKCQPRNLRTPRKIETCEIPTYNKFFFFSQKEIISVNSSAKNCISTALGNVIVKSLLFRGARSSCYFKPRWVWPRVLLSCDPCALSSAGERQFTASLHIHLVLWRFLPIAINPSDSNQSHYPLTPHRMWFLKILFVFGNTEVFKKFLRSKSSQSIIKKWFPSLMSLGVLPNPDTQYMLTFL